MPCPSFFLPLDGARLVERDDRLGERVRARVARQLHLVDARSSKLAGLRRNNCSILG
jgi:hypothetical protein